MKEFDYIILGGGCAGLSLAYELEIYNKLKDKTLAIIEPREEYIRDKTWSFWKVSSHNFEDCVKKSWPLFNVKNRYGKEIKHYINEYPYQAIDSGLFYKKVLNTLKKNKNISFFKNTNDINLNKSFIFNSFLNIKKFKDDKKNYWQHFLGLEIETKKKLGYWLGNNEYNTNEFTLMDFDTVPNIVKRLSEINFMYVLPIDEHKVFLETTWISKGGVPEDGFKYAPYSYQILEQLRRWSIIDNPFLGSDEEVDDRIDKLMKGEGGEKFKINYREQGAIPLFHPEYKRIKNQINIGSVGGMTRLSTGYTFLNIQEHSNYIMKNIDNISEAKIFEQNKKYLFFDKIFMKVLEKHPEKMPEIFFNIFSGFSKSIIKFLSNKSNIVEDLSIILKMPKWTFIKGLFK